MKKSPYDTKIETFSRMVRESKKIVAFTGSGISTDSGIPDLSGIDRILRDEKQFRGGVFSLLSTTFAKRNPDMFYKLYRKTFFQPSALPNACHLFLAQLETQKKLLGIATMNIDCLHQKAGNLTVYEYWGNMRLNHCVSCNQSYDWHIAQENQVPLCQTCGKLILPDFVLRNLRPYSNKIEEGTKMIGRADLIIIAGTRQNWRHLPSQTQKVVINLEMPYNLDDNTLFIQENITKVFHDVAQAYSYL